jgi:OOP family OmpA-OmpF porin
MRNKQIFILLAFYGLLLSAQEITNSNIIKPNKPIGEYEYLKPINVELAPVEEIEDNDQDKDGILDKNDQCPNTKEGEEVDKVGCLIKQDSDNDGVPDVDEKCPDTPAGIKVDYRGCEVDSDNDGIPDSKDRCIATSKEFTVDGYGCPQTATLKVHFKTDRYEVTDDLIHDLQNFALFLKENKGYNVIIYGYTDSSGNASANKILSQKRANSVREALGRYGIDKSRLTSIGKGKENPIGDNKTSVGRAQNRRIEVELIQ